VFDPERKLEIGKDPINVLVINAGLLTNRIKEEAERLYSSNKHKCILIHCEDLRNRYFGADEKNIEKIAWEGHVGGRFSAFTVAHTTVLSINFPALLYKQLLSVVPL
jgi:hypothetical protein